MEIKFMNISSKERKYKFKHLNLKISNNKITGVLGDNKNIIPRLLTGNINYQGTIMVDKLNILGYDLKKISYIEKLNKNTFLTKLVSDEFYLKRKDIKVKDTIYLEKITSSLNMVGLEIDYLKREIRTLSKSERRLLQIALGLITNPELIIIEEPFLYLDNKNTYNIKKIILDLKEKYDKTIIVLSNDSNVLYKISDNLIILQDNQVLVSGKMKSIFKDKEFLNDKEIKLPDILVFKNLSKNYEIDLDECTSIDELVEGVIDNVRKDQENESED